MVIDRSSVVEGGVTGRADGVVTGVGVGGPGPVMVSEAVTVTGEPAEGVITTVAVYEPAPILVMLTENVIVDVAIEISLLLSGLTDSQICEGVPAVQVNVLPPILVITMACATGSPPPTVALYVSCVVLTCMLGAAILIATGKVIGLPLTGRLVVGSMALIITFA